MKCPLCTTTELMMTDRQGVEIDYCPNCRGVWLDRGELDKIIERSYSSTSQPQYEHSREHNPFQKKHHDKHYSEHEGGSYRHPKKSWLAELFD